MWIARDGTQNVVHSVSIILEYPFDLLHVWAFLARRNTGQSEIHQLHDGLSSSAWVCHQEGKTSWPQMCEKARRQRRPSGPPIEEEMQKAKIPRNPWHDRFLRDHEFRIRMIEHHRDEDLCRRWDALADEDHTHHLTAQKYFHYKNEWWLHSNKQGSNTMPLRHRPVFKQALSTLQRLQQEAEEEPQVPTCSNKPKQWEAQGSSSTWWNWQGSWWTPYHSESQEGDAPSIEWTVRPVTCSIWQASSKKDFHELNLFCYRLIVYSWRRSTVTDGRCKYNTSNDPFSKCESQQEIRVQV